MDSVSIISVPFNGGQPRSGVEKGPQELHNAGLISVVEKAGWKVSLLFRNLITRNTTNNSEQ